MGKLGRWQNWYISYFSQKIGYDIGDTICMKCQGLISGMSKPIFWEKREKCFKISSAEIFTQHAVLFKMAAMPMWSKNT